ncbi:phospholipase D-like domain-containing protein [Micromonospora sp. 4G57]|uniref:phospholipase D n=1 Tax=Micromonospora sicca TaxID=2202420 RepID=A0ABU5JBM2_9ACTN|nr:phospholipase D-like domain-containing protein [Micromonospora sp. 4G57]MDZ5441574.1 phospholipase D-like domain-containing protein [Micromonospora sp. 4G57]MDZ5489971.1 phospholipase D-like domain-containing protein [Micromonospora sp. 4G53]
MSVSAASATLAGYPVWAHFTDPTAGRDYTILTELQRLIDAAPAGSTIRGAIHSLSVDSIADALLRAQSRGVTVTVNLDGKNAASTDSAVATIKQLSNYQFCLNSSGGHGCISTSAAGDMHTKLFTFTSTTDPNGVARNNVVWSGSSNLTYATGPDAFNNAITVHGDAALAAGLNANFTDMWNRRHYSGNDYYDAASGRGYYQAARGRRVRVSGRGRADRHHRHPAQRPDPRHQLPAAGGHGVGDHRASGDRRSRHPVPRRPRASSGW